LIVRINPYSKQVLVCNPHKNALVKAGNKSDRIDARNSTVQANALETRFSVWPETP
jgi:hypothetical protein